MHSLTVLFGYLLLQVIRVNGANWDYGKHGPDVWGESFPACWGKKQSPINIRTRCTVYREFEPFQFTTGHDAQIKFILVNNGHTIVATPNTSAVIALTGGNLQGKYNFQSFHIHWGPNHNSGSEHQVNGIKYAGEAHFVYIQSQTGQRAVLSFFMGTEPPGSPSVRERQTSNEKVMEKQWQDFFDAAHELSHESNSTTVALTLSVLMQTDVSQFWRYEGSLTTPGCDEGVLWTVFKRPILILDYDFEDFRDDSFLESYRGPQPLYDRQVYRSFPEETYSSIPDENLCLTKASNATFFFSFFHELSLLILFCILLAFD